MSGRSPRNRAWWIVVAAAMAPVGTACPSSPVVPEAPAAFTLHVANNSSEDIAYLYVAPVGSETWGRNLLGDDSQIPPGSSWPVQVAPGVYDLRAEDFERDPVGSVAGARIDRDSEWILQDE